MNCKYKIVKTLFSVLIVLVLLCSFAFNIFAYDSPALYSSGGSFSGNDIYTGNVDYLFSFYSESADITYSHVVNPCFSLDENLGTIDLSVTDSVSFKEDGSYSYIVDFLCSYSDFECSDNFYSSFIPPVNSYFGSNFGLTVSPYGSYYPDLMTVEARDFYFYLDPGSDLSGPNYDDYFCESFLYLTGKSMYSGGAEATICYVEAGVEDSASNYKYYDYSLSSSVTNGLEGTYFPVLPSDMSFDGAYSEPTLIYVKYLTFSVPWDGENDPTVSGIYASYNLDYRNIDLSSYVAPEAPMNPDIFRDYTGWIGSAVGGFLDLQIVDGFTLGGILMVIIAFMITLWFLKVFAGG